MRLVVGQDAPADRPARDDQWQEGPRLLPAGQRIIPENWDGFIERQQETADILSKEQDHPELDVTELYDRRYEKVIAEAVKGGQ